MAVPIGSLSDMEKSTIVRRLIRFSLISRLQVAIEEIDNEVPVFGRIEPRAAMSRTGNYV